jgi:hypothetical protein
MKAKNRILTFGAVLFSLLLTNASLAQSQVSPITTPQLKQLPTRDTSASSLPTAVSLLAQQQTTSSSDFSQRTEGNWIGLASGAIVALIGAGFGLVLFQKSQKLEREKLELQQSLEREKLELQQSLEREKLELQRSLEQEKLAWEQRLEQEKLELQRSLEQEKLAWEQRLEQEKLELQRSLEQEKLAWEREKLTLETEKLQFQYDLKLEQQRQEAELQEQLSEAEAEETAYREAEAEAEAIEEMALEEEIALYRDKVLADLYDEKILAWKRQNLNQID